MRACASCFAAATWISNASPPESSPATCAFGHDYSAQTWPTTAWVDSLSRLLSVYEIAESGKPIEVCIQNDWAVFSLSRDDVRKFIESAFIDGHELLRPGKLVQLKHHTDGTNADHIGSWTSFSREIRAHNRYFPRSVPDINLLSRVLLDTATLLAEDVDLYRARSGGTKALTAGDLGAPPKELATAGRANPVGIPYLYLAYSMETCIYETRAPVHSSISVGRFRPTRQLKVLNLADIDAPDFFSIPEVDSVDDQVSQVEMHQYLRALSLELTKPVRASDQPTDYIPTQYLCEFAKSQGLDGVLYSSSLHSGGRNLVLFDTNAAACIDDPLTVEITSLQLEWETEESTPSQFPSDRRQRIGQDD